MNINFSYSVKYLEIVQNNELSYSNSLYLDDRRLFIYYDDGRYLIIDLLNDQIPCIYGKI